MARGNKTVRAADEDPLGWSKCPSQCIHQSGGLGTEAAICSTSESLAEYLECFECTNYLITASLFTRSIEYSENSK